MASLVFPRMPASLAATPSTIAPLTSKSELAARLAAEFSLSEKAIQSVLARAEFTPSVIERMRHPYEARPYAEYRPLFVNQRLADLGESYLTRHRAFFDQAMKRYGVQAEIIAAILGMETHYGKSRGRDKVLNALYTLSSGYPKRASFFRKELGHFILLCREEHLQPDKPVGSYAGAFGTTQFIPSSYRHYAVDADGDGRRDVWNSPADIISSVANYFHLHGWDARRPVARWLPRHTTLKAISAKGASKWRPLGELRPLLPVLPAAWKNDDRVSLIELDAKTGRRTLLVHYNFYVITRWNHSSNYAMAATELAHMMGCDACDAGV